MKRSSQGFINDESVTVDEQDPQYVAFKYLADGDFDTCFASEDDLISHIAEGDPVMFGLDISEAKDFSQEVNQILSSDNESTSNNLEMLNKVTGPILPAEVCGALDGLVAVSSDTVKNFRLSFRTTRLTYQY